jgi:uncharacterized UPF0160 family protein
LFFILRFFARSWWPARAIVQRAMDGRKSVHESGEILLLDQFCPWKKHLFEIEENTGKIKRLPWGE